MLVGSNLDEGTIFVAPLQGFDVDAYRRFIRAAFRDRADDVLARFPVARDADVKPALARVLGYSAFVAPARRLARVDGRRRQPRYLYRSPACGPARPAARLGAFHGAEVPFVFGTFGRAGRRAARARGRRRGPGAVRGDDGILDPVRRDRRPERRGGGRRGRVTRSRGDVWLELGDEIQPRSGVAREICDFFDRVAAERPPRPPGRSTVGSRCAHLVLLLSVLAVPGQAPQLAPFVTPLAPAEMKDKQASSRRRPGRSSSTCSRTPRRTTSATSSSWPAKAPTTGPRSTGSCADGIIQGGDPLSKDPAKRDLYGTGGLGV